MTVKILWKSLSYLNLDGGWLNAHPLPADKSSYGNFDVAAQQNQKVIRGILESQTTATDPADEHILTKLRDFYDSCLNVDQMDNIGDLPLLQMTRTIKQLYREQSTTITWGKENVPFHKGLTAALAFLHSKG